MGTYEAELKLIATKAANISGDLNESIDAIPKAAEVLEDFARAFDEISRSLGFTGIAEELASKLFEEAYKITTVSHAAVSSMPEALDDARIEVKRAVTQYETLPETTIPMELRLAILGGSAMLIPGFGVIGGIVALDQYQQHLNRKREEAAKEALDDLAKVTHSSADRLFKEAKKIDPPPEVGDDERSWGKDRGRRPKPLPEPTPIDGVPSGTGAGADSGSWDQQFAPGSGAPQGGSAAAGVVGAGAAAGMAAGLGKIGGGSGNSGLTPGAGGSGGSGSGIGGRGAGVGAGGIGAGSRVSADSANAISRPSSQLGGSGANSGLSAGRSGLGGLGSKVGGLGSSTGAQVGGGLGAGSGTSGVGAGAAGSGSGLGGAGSTGAGGASGGRGMMMGGAGGGAAGGGDKDKSRGSLGYRAPKIEADPRGRNRVPTGEAGSRADFPESAS